MKNNLILFIKFFAFGVLLSSIVFGIFKLIFPEHISLLDFLLEVPTNIVFAAWLTYMFKESSLKISEEELKDWLHKIGISFAENESQIIGNTRGLKAFFYNMIVFDKRTFILSAPRCLTCKMSM